MNESSIHVLREGRPLAPMPPEAVRAELAAGRLRGSDLAWRPGQAGWRPLAELVGGGAPVPMAASVAPPPPVPPPVPGAPMVPAPSPVRVVPAVPRLWDLLAAGRWGVLLGPAVPAFVAWKNWQTLGEPVRAAPARLGFLLLAVLQVVMQTARTFAGEGAGRGLTVLWLLLGLGYHYLGARPAAVAQAARAAGTPLGPRRPLWRPLLAGAGAQLALALVLGVALGAWEAIPDVFGTAPRLEVKAITGPYGQAAVIYVVSHEQTSITVRRVVANGHADLRHKVAIGAGFVPGSERWVEPAVLKTGESLDLYAEGLGLEDLRRVRVETDRGAYECQFEAGSQR